MADPAEYRYHPGRVGGRIIMQGVLANMFGYGDYAVAAGHNGAVTANGIMSVHAGDVDRAR